MLFWEVTTSGSPSLSSFFPPTHNTLYTLPSLFFLESVDTTISHMTEESWKAPGDWGVEKRETKKRTHYEPRVSNHTLQVERRYPSAQHSTQRLSIVSWWIPWFPKIKLTKLASPSPTFGSLPLDFLFGSMWALPPLVPHVVVYHAKKELHQCSTHITKDVTQHLAVRIWEMKVLPSPMYKL